MRSSIVSVDYPLVSICLPTYNGEKYIYETLKSINNQTYSNIEIIISDNSSIDNTLEICERFDFKFPVKILINKELGIGNNWNNCLKYSKGDFIKFIFQDDLLKPNCVEKLVEILLINKEHIIVCKREIILENSNDIISNNWKLSYSDLQKHVENIDRKGELYVFSKSLFSDKNFLNPPLNKIGEPICGLIHKNVYKEIGVYNIKFTQAIDYEFWYRCLLIYNILLLDEKLVSFRVHKNQTTLVNKKNNVNEVPLYFKFLKKNVWDLLSEQSKDKISPSFKTILIKIGNKLKK